MAYLAIARKWRPSVFQDLVGQAHVVQTLKNALSLNRVSHAYLFCGARGVGKTSVARIFAKTLRCPNVVEAAPCNRCDECNAITEGRSVDVIEIDGASNNGVEAVRSIRDNVVYGASSGTYKIYIIDEVHMLSVSAFNALLKTLEEPPSHVIFIFATTEPQKIPLTILSRCQRFEFRRLKSSEIIARLSHILAAEKVQLSEEALRIIAAHSDGSLRDSLSLLDQVLSYHGREPGELSEKQIVESLGVSESNSVRNLLAAIIDEDSPAILATIEENYRAGIDLKHFAERVVESLRLLYLCVLARESKKELSPDELDISSLQLKEVMGWTEKVSLEQVERMSQILIKAVSQLGWTALPRYVLEMAAIRMSKLKQLSRIEAALLNPELRTISVARETEIVEESDSSEDLAPLPVTKTPSVVTASARPPLPQMPPSPISSGEMSGPPVNPRIVPVASPPPSAAQVNWKAFVDAVMKKRPLLGAILSHANFRMETVDGKRRVTLVFPPNSFYERQATDQRNRQEIEDQMKGFFGPDTTLFLTSDSKDTTTSLEETKKSEENVLRQNALQHPTVLKAKELLGAEVVDVHIDQ